MSATASLTAPAPSRGRALNITLWALQILLAAFFAFAGINKLLGLQQEMVDNFAKMGVGVWFRYLVGVLEISGAVALVIPRFSGAGAIWLSGVMIGAVITHLTVQPPAYQAIGPLVILALFGLITWGRWPQTKLLLDKLRG